MLAHEMGSIIKAIFDIESITVYTDRTQEDFSYPSIYYPKPVMTNYNYSVSSYAYDYLWNVLIFDQDSTLSFNRGVNISNSLNDVRRRINLIDENETDLGQTLRINTLNINTIDEGVTQVSIAWTSAYTYTTQTFDVINTYHFELEAKGG